MAQRKPIVCGLSARGIIPPPPEGHMDDDVAGEEEVVELSDDEEEEVVEISDDEEQEVVELSNAEYMSNMGYLIRVEESEDDIAPEVRRMLQRMHEEEKRLRDERFKLLKAGIKLEESQSSKGDGDKRKRRS